MYIYDVPKLIKYNNIIVTKLMDSKADIIIDKISSI